jgi:hypothetical protein
MQFPDKPLADLTDEEIEAQMDAEIAIHQQRAEQGLIIENDWMIDELTPEIMTYLERRAAIARRRLAERGLALPEPLAPTEPVAS